MSEGEMLGFYGKIPAHGDFVNRNLHSNFIRMWDPWLQDRMQYLTKELGTAWLEHYLVAPVWRFYLPSNVIDKQYWVGVWLPSVDRVGRYFPLVLAKPFKFLADGETTLADAIVSNWFLRLEELALSVLSQHLDADTIQSVIRNDPVLNSYTFNHLQRSSSVGCYSLWVSHPCRQPIFTMGLPDRSTFLSMVVLD